MSTLSVEVLKEKIASGKPMEVIDIRDEWEFEESHIEGRNIPMHEIPGRIEELQAIKDKDIVVYCNTGDRSATACTLLEQSGFPNVWSLEGGIEAWKAHETS